MTALDAVKDHVAAVRALVSWNGVGVLMDDGPQAIITVLLDGDAVAGASRFCLPAAHSFDRATRLQRRQDPSNGTALLARSHDYE